MTTVTILDYAVEVIILSYSVGSQPSKVGHPDNWTPGDPAYIEFVFSTDSELLNKILTENYYEEAEKQLLTKIKNDGCSYIKTY